MDKRILLLSTYFRMYTRYHGQFTGAWCGAFHFLTNYLLFTILLQRPDRHYQIRVEDQQLWL